MGARMNDDMRDFERKRRSRNLVLGGILLAMALLFFAITVARMT